MNYLVRDKNGTTWDYCTAKGAADTSRKDLDKRQPMFKPFRVEPDSQEQV